MRVIGRKPVLELLQSDKPVRKVLIVANAKGRIIGDIVREAKARKVRIDRIAPEQTGKLLGGGNHQGVGAEVSPVELLPLQALGGRKAPIESGMVVALDGVTDPHHLGAIARSGRGAGCDALILPARRSVQVNDIAIKASAGLLLQLPVIQTGNLSDALLQLKKQGWWVVGAAGEKSATVWEFEWPEKCVLVMGSEGEGLSQRVRKTCDSFVAIPLENNVESLSVSAAASVLLFDSARKRGELLE